MAEQLFWKIFKCKHLWRKILNHQTGVAYKDWIDGDKAITLGYSWLINSKMERKEELIFSRNAINCAARSGNMSMIKFLYDRDKIVLGSPMASAVESGDIEIVKFIHSKYPEKNNVGIADIASKMDRVDILQFLLEEGYLMSHGVFLYAIENKSLAVTKWAHKFKLIYIILSGKLIKDGSMAMIDFIVQKKYRLNEEAIYFAVKRKDPRIFEYLRRNGVCMTETLRGALSIGDLDLANRALENKWYNNKTDLLDLAMESRNIDAVIWVQEKISQHILPNMNIDFLIRESALDAAIGENNTRMLKLLMFNLCTHNDTLRLLVKHDKVEMVKKFHHTGTRSHGIIAATAITGNVELAEWLYKNGPYNINEMVGLGAANNKFEIVKWAYEKGVRVARESIQVCIARQQMDNLNWLHERGFRDEYIEDCIDCVFKHGNILYLDWIHARYPMQKRVIKMMKNPKIIKWYIDHDLSIAPLE